MNQLTQLLNRPFDLLSPPKNRLFLAIFCGLFATVFLYIFNPFNSLSWNYDESIAQYIGIVSSGLVAIPVLIFSQFIIRTHLFPESYKYKHFFIQLGIELCLLSLILFFIFGDRNPFGWSYINEFIGVIKHTIKLAALPYFMGLLILKVVSQKQYEKEIEQTPTPLQSIWVDIKDEKDKLILKLNIDHLLFFKSEDNYTSVYYIHNGEVQKNLVRTNLKKLEKELVDLPVLRTHRSYMVNLKKLVSVTKDGKGYKLKIAHIEEQALPVSGSYKATFEQQTDRMSYSPQGGEFYPIF